MNPEEKLSYLEKVATLRKKALLESLKFQDPHPGNANKEMKNPSLYDRITTQIKNEVRQYPLSSVTLATIAGTALGSALPSVSSDKVRSIVARAKDELQEIVAKNGGAVKENLESLVMAKALSFMDDKVKGYLSAYNLNGQNSAAETLNS